MTDFNRKRGRTSSGFSGNAGFKRSREEMDSFTTGVGSKSKPCTKFFSTNGCSFGDSCHFLHYFPGYNAHIQLANMGGNTGAPTGRNAAFTDGPAPPGKTKLCSKLNTPEGCRFGDKCRFAHSEMELGRSSGPGYDDPRMMGPPGRFPQRFEPSGDGFSRGNFGATATAKISIDASYAGPIIGKNGVNSKQICRETGVKLSIRDHETDPSQKNIELEGSFDRIKEASAMVRELIMNISAAGGRPERSMGSFDRRAPPNQYKKKMCEKFSKGSCTFGERCHFAHSASELGNFIN